MVYMGSKRRISKDILPIILKDRRPDEWYVEPFVGGGNLIDKVEGLRLGADLNPFAIQALTFIRDRVQDLPKDNTEFTEADYQAVKAILNHPLKGYAGFALSYSGKWFGGWCRDGQGKRDYVGEAYRNAVKQSLKLRGVRLIHSDYRSLWIPPRSIIYCDPPYAGTTKYKDRFDSKDFWQWCEQLADGGQRVFVSEYSAPHGWQCVWEKEIVSSLTQNTGSKKGVEKLFVSDGGYNY